MTESTLGRHHHQRLREVYRSSGWPCHDILEVDLLATGLLERRIDLQGHETLRVTDAGILQLGQTHASNQAARSVHESLVERVCIEMGREGRVVWRGLSLRALVPKLALTLVPGPDSAVGQTKDSADSSDLLKDTSHACPLDQTDPTAQWAIACPDVFSIRNTSVEAYLEPIVHEIKVSRADLLGDLKKPNKRAAYLGLGGECWYVLGQNAKGRPIAQPDEIPPECGVMLVQATQLIVARPAPRRPMARMPFHIWMALAKAAPALRFDATGQTLL